MGRRFHESYTLQGMRKLLIRHGFSPQVPARGAVERDEEAIHGRGKETSPQAVAPRRRSGPRSSAPTRPSPTRSKVVLPRGQAVVAVAAGAMRSARGTGLRQGLRRAAVPSSRPVHLHWSARRLPCRGRWGGS
ncbi:helix-turn-helix domain-containing protein [Streptomyces broussonetiae]|uniref:helix-turn-helix domain-containing protein n=1 Tax=Streptomyces broussonetiae TaxID=2686304 RepID=UPI0040644CB4